MATPYTLTLREAEERLRDLVAQADSRFIVLTSEETAEPVAVMLGMEMFNSLRQQRRQLFHMQLHQLLQTLDELDRSLVMADQKAVADQITSFRNVVRALWDVSEEAQRGLALTLEMASRHLSPERLDEEQLAALRFCLELMRGQANVSEIDECHRRLIAAGLPPTVPGDEALLQMYVDEL